MSKRYAISKVAIIALVFGAVGAVGQAYLLYRTLINNLPFKEIDPEFYQGVAATGVWLAPLIAVSVGAIIHRRSFHLSLLLPVILSPFLFAIVFASASVLYGVSMIEPAGTLGDFTEAKAAYLLFSECGSLAITGLMIGGIAALILWFITKCRK